MNTINLSQSKAIVASQNVKERDFWLEKLSDTFAINHFPYDFLQIDTKVVDQIERPLSKYISLQLLKLAGSSDYKLHMILVTIVTILVNKYTEDTDVLIGFPIYNQDFEGVFVNTVLVLKNIITEGMNFKDLLIQTRERIIEAIENQNYPLEVLASNFDKKGVDNNLSLFDIVVMVENIHNKKYLQDYNYNCLFSFRRVEDKIFLTIEYNSLCYRKSTIERLVTHLKTLLLNIFANIDLDFTQISIMSESEREDILIKFNNRVLDFPRDKTISQRFEENAAKIPHEIAVICGDQKLTYKELNEHANQLARLLRERGIGPDRLVGVLCKRGLEMIKGILAIFKAGGAYIPLDQNYPIDRIKRILGDSGASAILITNEAKQQIPNLHENLSSVPTLYHIVYLDQVKNLNLEDALFKTSKLANLLAKDNDIILDTNLVLAEGNHELEYATYMERIVQFKKFITEKIQIPSPVALISKNPIQQITVISSLKEANVDYELINPHLPAKEKINLLETMHVKTIITDSDFIKELNHFFWQSTCLQIYINIEEYEVKNVAKEEQEKFIGDYISSTTTYEINDYVLNNSYTAEPFTREEVQQYIDNFTTKLSPYIDQSTKVLDIGCGHGLVMSSIAPQVKYYLATDLSQIILEKNKEQYDLNNVEYQHVSASQISLVKEKEFDLVVVNNVVHFFPDNFFLEKMIKDAIQVLKDEGIIYLDDLLNIKKKDELIDSLIDFKKEHPEAKTKVYWEDDLFVHPEFFHYLQLKYPEIKEYLITEKLGSIKNELTKFRYDVLLKIDKKQVQQKKTQRVKSLYTLEDIRNVKVSQDQEINFELSNKKWLDILGGVLDCTTVRNNRKEDLENINTSSDLAYVIYTSGSTGKPKGAMVEHAGMMNHIYAKIADLQLTDASIIAQNASHSFDVSVWQFFAALEVGGKTSIYDDEIVLKSETFITQIKEDQVTILEVVPSYLSIMLDTLEIEHYDLNELCYLLVTGETVKPDLIRRWFTKYPQIKVVNAYGPTEASDDITHYIMSKPVEGGTIPIGRTLPNLKIYIVDSKMNLCPIGVKGEICVTGIGVGRGYLNDEKRTAAVFGEDPFAKDKGIRLYKTGDIGRWREDGTIEFFGRKDYQVKIRGYRIEIGEVENKLITHPNIKQVVVIDWDNDQSKYLVAYLVADRQISSQKMKKYLIEQLPEYMIPTYFVQLDQLPLTPNGKVNRKALPEPVVRSDNTDLLTPRDDLEVKIAEIWKEILKIEQVSIQDDFFIIGGHSLNVTTLINKLHKEFDINLTLGQIFKNPTITKQAEVMKKAQLDKFMAISRAPEMEYYPLSSAQKRMYILQEINKETINYNVPQIFQIADTFTKERLESIFRELIHRHEVFRTSFGVIKDEPVQKIHNQVDFAVKYYDFSDSVNKQELVDGIIESFVQPFDLSKAPLLRVSLIKLAEDGNIMMMDTHHIISDGASEGILINDFLSLYAGGELSELKLQYKDYVMWQNSPVQQERIKKQEVYWVKQFSGNLPTFNLPADFAPQKRSFGGDTVSIYVVKEDTQRFRKITKEHNSTLFMTLLAVYNIFLQKISGQDDIIVGVPIEGRKHADLDKIVGMFVNTLPLRNQPRNDKTYSEFLQEIKSNTLKAFENQDYQFEDLVSRLQIPRSERNPLFDAVFILQNQMISFTNEALHHINKFEYRKISSEFSKFDLVLETIEEEEVIRLNLQYSTDLFRRTTIEDMGTSILKIVTQITENPDIRIADIKLIEKKTKHQEIVADFEF